MDLLWEPFPSTGSILSGSNRGPRPGSDEPKNVRDLSVFFFVGPVFEYVSADMKAISLKRASENRVLHGILKGR